MFAAQCVYHIAKCMWTLDPYVGLSQTVGKKLETQLYRMALHAVCSITTCSSMTMKTLFAEVEEVTEP